MTSPKVCLTGGDGVGWALDEDVRLTRQAIERRVEFTAVEHCEVLHSVWWEPLLSMAPAACSAKRIVCHMSGEPFRYLCLPRHRHVVSAVDRWITQTTQATKQCAAVGLPHTYIPIRQTSNRSAGCPSGTRRSTPFDANGRFPSTGI